MKEKICCFAGHSSFNDNDIFSKIYNKCEEIITQNGITTFWVGNYGKFDRIASNVLLKLKDKYPLIEIDLVIPYLVQSINRNRDDYYAIYDHILISDIPSNTPAKMQILKCNQYIINSSSHLIAYVNYPIGGAAKTLQYARKKNLKIYNLGNPEI